MPEPKTATTGQVWVYDPSGAIGTIPAAELRSALAADYRLAESTEEVEDAIRRQRAVDEADTIAGQALAVGEGLAEGATLGASRVVASGLLGPDYVDRADARRETGAGIAANVAGVIAPALLSGGAALPAGALARVGVAGGERVAAVVATKLGGGALAKAAGKVAGMTAEGAGTGTVMKVAENATGGLAHGDELTRDLLFADVGEAAMFGGVAGGTIGAAGQAAKGAVAAAKVGAAKVAGVASDALAAIRGQAPEGSIVGKALDKHIEWAAKVSGADEGQIRKVMTEPSVRADWLNKESNLKELVDGSAEHLDDVLDVKNLTRDLAAGELKAANVARTVKRGDDTIIAARTEIDSFMGRVDGMADDARVAEREAKAASAELDRAMRHGADDATLAPLREAASAKAGAVGRVEAMDDAFGANAKTVRHKINAARNRLAAAVDGGDEADIYVAIENSKRDFDDLAKKAKQSSLGTSDVTARTQLEQTYTLAREQSDGFRTFLENPEVWGQAAINQARRNKALSSVINTSKDFESRFVRTFAEAEPHTMGTAKIRKGDPSKIESYYKRLGSDMSGAFEHQQTLRHLDSEEELLTAFIEGGEAEGKNLARIEKARDSVREFRRKIADGSERMQNANILDEIVKRGEQGFLGGGMLSPALTGGLLGGPLGAMAGAAIGALARPGQLAQQIAITESVVQRAAKLKAAVGDSVAALVRRKIGVPMQSKLRAGRRALMPAVSFGRDRDEKTDGYRKRMKQLDDMKLDPQLQMAAVSRITAGLDDAAPDMMTGIAAKHALTLDYLRSKAPRPPDTMRTKGEREQWRPRYEDVVRFERQYRAVTDPHSVVEDAKANELTYDAVLALKETHRALWDEMRRQAMVTVAESEEPIDYDTSVQLSILFDFSATAATDADFLAQHQQIMGSRTDQEAQDQAKKQPQSVDVPETFSASAETLSERVAAGT